MAEKHPATLDAEDVPAVLENIKTPGDLPNSRLRDEIQALDPTAQNRAMEIFQDIAFPTADLDHLHVCSKGTPFYICGSGCEHAYDVESLAKTADLDLENEVEEALATFSTTVPVSPFPESLKFHSNPGAPYVIYLNFAGETISGTAWNNHATWAPGPSVPILVKPLNLTGEDPFTYSPLEQQRIFRTWLRVAEDYAPFNINVTTERPSAAMFDTNHVVNVVFTERFDQNGNQVPFWELAAGVASINTFGNSNFNSFHNPAWVFTKSQFDRYMGDVASHEAGHTFGLLHHGLSGAVGQAGEYYSGHGSGETQWMPIMGNVGLSRAITQWSNGEYRNSNRNQDDIAIIASKTGYRTDDHGDTNATATPLTISSGGVITSTIPETDPENNVPHNKGIIGSRTDVDVFSFQTGAGIITLNVDPFRIVTGTQIPGMRGTNLDVSIELYNSAGTLVASDNPPNDTIASITYNAAPGTYFLHVSGSGAGDPFANPPSGYTDYGSIGQYFISGSIIETDYAPPVVEAGANQTASLATMPWSPTVALPTAWYDASDPATITASGGVVTQWDDKSGNANHLTQSDPTRRPTTGNSQHNGLDILDFSEDYIFTSTGLGADIRSVFMVHSINTTITASSPPMLLLSTAGGGISTGDGYGSSTGAFTGEVLSVFDEDTTSFAKRQAASSATLPSIPAGAHLYTYALGTDWFIGLDGSDNLRDLTSGASRNPMGFTNSFSIGADARQHPAPVQDFYDGSAAEVILIEEALDSDERQKAEGYLAHKWCLTDNLPNNHPYKANAPTSPAAIVMLDGSAIVSAGLDLTVLWTVVSGPGSVGFGNSTALETTATFTADGIYTLRLTVNDGTTEVFDEVEITVVPSGGPYATGGTITQAGGYFIHTFTEVGADTFAVIGNQTLEVDVLVVGGGGGGGSSTGFSTAGAGGGGAGGLINLTGLSASGEIDIIVGSPGTAGGPGNTPGDNGGNSSFGTLVALGGGGGSGGNMRGLAGGSGGGSRGNASGGAAMQPGSTSGGLGNAGGGWSSSADHAAGGGGGAGGVAASSPPSDPLVGGPGGIGLAFDISGSTVHYAGGGGGAGSTNSPFGTGGLGGGGNGGNDDTAPSPGAPNTGGGGGGGNNNRVGADGGSGIVIVRYPASSNPPSIYLDWAVSNGLSGSDLQPAAILRPDGLTNLAKFAFGLDPNLSMFNSLEFIMQGELTTPGMPTLLNLASPGTPDDMRTIFIRRKDYAAAGLTYTVHFSADLKQWTPSDVLPTVVTDEHSISVHEVVSIPFPDSVPVDDTGPPRPARFMRVSVLME